MKEWFRKFAGTVSNAAGSWQAFVGAVLLVVIWFMAGFFVGFTGTFYQLLINTGTTIITFLMVFLIQNTQNRDAKSIHLKLDELIKATKGARNSMIDLDKLSDAQLKSLEEEYKRICAGEGEQANVSSSINAVQDELTERSKQSKN
jgi:low affinity Fe/Cu permease